jgi:hypothetical protein
MSTHFDPEGNELQLHPTTALSLLIPAGRTVFLYASFEGGWEQAVVIHLDGQRFENQLGSYILRPSVLEVPKQSADYTLTPPCPGCPRAAAASALSSSPGTIPRTMRITATSASSSSPIRSHASFTVEIDDHPPLIRG